MRSVTSTVVLVGLTLAGAAIHSGCNTDDSGTGNNPTTPTVAGSAGGSAVPSSAGSSSAGNAGMSGSAPATAGAASGGVATGGAASGGAATGGASSGGQSTAGSGGGAQGGAAGAAATSGDITKVWKSNGCGKPFGGTSGQKVSIQTMGTKASDCADKLNNVAKCGSYTISRDYFVYMPSNYDMNKAYPLVIQAPGCGGTGEPKNIYGLPDVANQVIRIGISPPPNSIGHGTNENEGCFDDKEGDDSVDWVFYENFYDKLNTDVCFDRNRVFSAGNSSGSWFSNELGCKYAGDAMRPVRAIMPNTGGLPSDPKWAPACTSKPLAGMWVHETGDPTNAFSGNKFAIDRALKVNGCTGATSYDAKVSANEYASFPIGGNNPDTTCRLLQGCPELYPLVVCPLSGSKHDPHDSVANPGFATFVKKFSMGSFLTQ